MAAVSAGRPNAWSGAAGTHAPRAGWRGVPRGVVCPPAAKAPGVRRGAAPQRTRQGSGGQAGGKRRGQAGGRRPAAAQSRLLRQRLRASTRPPNHHSHHHLRAAPRGVPRAAAAAHPLPQRPEATARTARCFAALLAPAAPRTSCRAARCAPRARVSRLGVRDPCAERGLRRRLRRVVPRCGQGSDI